MTPTCAIGGLYKLDTPLILGNEVSGVLVKMGSKVGPEYGYQVGDRVAAYTNLTGYAQYTTGLPHRTAKLPDGITNKMAAAALLQGLTALTALREAYPAQKGDYILVRSTSSLIELTK
jgi:NADPH2:quinone reductase